MKNPRLAALAAALFEQPVSYSYAILGVILISIGCAVTYSDNNLPYLVRHIVMLATLVGIARFFSSPLLRWAWTGIVSLLGLAVVLDIALISLLPN